MFDTDQTGRGERRAQDPDLLAPGEETYRGDRTTDANRHQQLPNPKPKRRNGACAQTGESGRPPQQRGESQSHARQGRRTRAVGESQAALRDSQKATSEKRRNVGDYAERAVLIPVGAALIARERSRLVRQRHDLELLVATKAQAQLRRFERRGVTARNRLEREVRKTRVRFERELRQRRKNVERTVNGAVRDIEKRRDAISQERQRDRRPRAGARQPRSRSASSAWSRPPAYPARSGEGPKRESLPASYPAGSSSTLSSLDPPGGPHRPGVCSLRGRAVAPWAGRAFGQWRDAHARRDPQGPGGRDRPRAASLDRRARHGPLDRGEPERGRRRHRLADDARLPDQGPLPDRRRRHRRQARRRLPRATSTSTCSARSRRRRSSRSSAAAGPAGRRPRAGRERDLHRLGQGRRGQVDADREPRRRAGGRRPARGRARRRRVGLLDPAHVRARLHAPGGLRPAQDHPVAGARREA